MSLNPWILRVAILTAIGLPFADPADAQTCNTPIPLIGEPIVIATCVGDTNLPVVCNGAVPLTGPALVMSVHLPYPNGRLQVQSMDAGLDAAAFLLQGPCYSDAFCVAAEEASGPGGTASIELDELDSGDYFLVIAPYDDGSPGPACGPVAVSWIGNPSSPLDGLFRSNFTPTLDLPEP